MDVIDSFTGDYSFLSNFHCPAPVHLLNPDGSPGYWFRSVEHAYQAAKTLDVLARRPFVNIGMTPGQAKRAGKLLKLRADWEDVRLHVMEDLLRQKFAADPLRAKLIATQSAQLIEGNNWGDSYWGMVRTPAGTLVGANNLGRLLMQIRLEVNR